ncbi:TonB C-terminal domain-containing protein [Gemmobacter lanyuensis]
MQGQMASHVKRTRAGAKAKLVLSVQIDGAGRMMAVSVRQSSGDAGLDARIAAHAQARGRWPPRQMARDDADPAHHAGLTQQKAAPKRRPLIHADRQVTCSAWPRLPSPQ